MIYLASVYSLDAKTESEEHKAIREERYLTVMKKVNELLRANMNVFSPIVHCHPMSNVYGLPKDFYFWERLDRAYLDMCDVLWVLKMEGWERSEGIQKEIEYAKYKGMFIHYEEV